MRSNSNANGHVVKHPPPDACDWLYVLNSQGAEFLLKQCFAGRRSVTPRDVHLLGAVAESG